MEISRRDHAGGIELAVAGRLDSYWAGHFDAALAAIVRDGHDRVTLDLSGTTFLSSAGVAVLLRYYKQLARIKGSLAITAASEAVGVVLEMTRLTALLVTTAPAASPAASADGRRVQGTDAEFDVFDLDAAASLTCRTIGDPTRLSSPGASEGHEVTCHESLFMLGIGGIGRTFQDCRDRFGDLLAADGAVVYQPADSSNVPDYLVGRREAGGAERSAQHDPVARMLYGLACEGSFSMLARFEPASGTTAAALPALAQSFLDIARADAIGVVAVAEVAGLVGAALRQSPFVAAAAAGAAGGFFAHPRVRERLTFTTERAFSGNVALIVGVVARGAAAGHPQLRPAGGKGDLAAHFHAAVFPFRPFRKGRIELRDTVSALFESERVLGVLHLVHDDRAGGTGLSEFARGACWMAPIREWT